MEYIAHKNGERVQTVKEHLYGTAELAGSFAEKVVANSHLWGRQYENIGGVLH